MSQINNIGVPGGSTTIVQKLTGNSGGAVGPDSSHNINLLGSGSTTVVGNPGTNTLTISSNATFQIANYTVVVHSQSPYTVLSTDYYIGANVTSGVISILLPNAPTTGRIFVVKDVVGLSATSNITITTVGGAVNIDGSTSYIMNTNYASIQLIFDGTKYQIY